MTRDDIIRMAREADAYEHYVSEADDMPWSVEFSLTNLEAFAALVAAAKERQMIADGWRHCAQGQRTTQFCGLTEQAITAEREACLDWCAAFAADDGTAQKIAAAIRARGGDA